jgi:hypothetical protein
VLHPRVANSSGIIDIGDAMAADKKIFAVIAVSKPDALKVNIDTLFPDANLSVGVGQWLLIGPSSMTTQELAIKLNISVESPTSIGIVLSVNSYFGRAPLNVWEWLTAKMGDASAVAG